MIDPIWTNNIVDLYQGDCREVLAALPAQSVHCVVTSPPYWGLRDYGVGEVGIGLEATPELYTEHIVEVFRQVRRVLRDNGTLWLNLGDSYAGSQKGYMGNGKWSDRTNVKQGTNAGSLSLRPVKAKSIGLKSKDLVGIPWRVAFALQADGWYLRSDIIWNKPNPMPESVTDRPTKNHEYIFLLTKSGKYYYDAEAIRESQVSDHPSGNGFKRDERLTYRDSNGARGNDNQWHPSSEGRNKRSVWTIATHPFLEAHFATFPEKLIEPCILAGSPKNGIVLDPFIGSGTTAIVAQRLNRRCIGIDASETYLKEIAIKRITGVALPMQLDV